MPIPTVSRTSELSIAQMNALADVVDDAFEKLFLGCSPLLWLPLDGGGSWRESGLGGIMVVFGTQASRKILSSVASHDQAALDSLAATASIIPGEYEHTRKHVTLSLDPLDFDTSLKIQKRWVTLTPEFGGAQYYWVRIPSITVGSETYHYHEHRHEYAVLDVVLEGHASRAFTFDAAWDKFCCVRIHNLDADATPVTVTFEGTPDLEVDVPRWSVKTFRRVGTTWVEQGFLLFRHLDTDLARMGGTVQWNDRQQTAANPWQYLREADAANNVASFGSLCRWVDYFSRLPCPPDVRPYCGEGLGGAFNPRTGLWYDLTEATAQAALSGMPVPSDTATPLWRFCQHGGSILLVRNMPSPDPAVIEYHDLTIDQLLAGTGGSGLALQVIGSALKLVVTDAMGADSIDVIPLSSNLNGGAPMTLSVGSPVTIAGWPTLGSVAMDRLAVDATITETIYGATTVNRAYTQLEIETGGIAPASIVTATVADVANWTFADTTISNAHTTIGAQSVAWDGRKLVVCARATLAPSGGAHITGTYLGTILARGARADGASLALTQASLVQAYPGKGGVWGTPEYGRGVWAPLTQETHHALTLNPYGDGTDADCSYSPMTTTPRSSIARLEAVPPLANYAWSRAGYRASDSAHWLAENDIDAAWWAANRTAAMTQAVLPTEVRPDVVLRLHRTHYNALAVRLNALREIVPFSFLDAQWYGRPFRPDAGDAGLWGGYVYPGDHLCTTPDGSTAQSRATALGITVRTIAADLPILTSLQTQAITGVKPDGSTHTAFASVNLVNDVLAWIAPELVLDYGDVTMVSDLYAPGSPPSGFVEGAAVPGHPSFYWYATTNPQAALPAFKWVRTADVKAAADTLGIPFMLERLCLPLKIVVWTPIAFNRYWSRQNALATRTQASLVVDTSDTPQLVAFAGNANPLEFLRWAAGGMARLARWPVCPLSPGMSSSDALVNEMTSRLDQGYFRGTSGGSNVVEIPYAIKQGGAPTHSVPGWEAWWQNGSAFDGEAPRVLVQSIVPAGVTAGKLLCLPVPAVQWGASDVEANPPPATGILLADLTTLGTIVEPDDIALAGGLGGWNGKGGWQIGLIPGGYTL